MYEHSMKIQASKVKILTLKYTSLPGKSQRLDVGFVLFRIIFTSPKLAPKLDVNEAAYVIAHVSMNYLYEPSICFS